MYSCTLEKMLLSDEKAEGYFGVIYRIQKSEGTAKVTYVGILMLTNSRMIFESEDKTFREIHILSEIDKVSHSLINGIKIILKESGKCIYLLGTDRRSGGILRFFQDHVNCTFHIK